jgi:hypothetical protein
LKWIVSVQIYDDSLKAHVPLFQLAEHEILHKARDRELDLVIDTLLIVSPRHSGTPIATAIIRTEFLLLFNRFSNLNRGYEVFFGK